MKQTIHHITKVMSVALLAGASLSSCIYENDDEPLSGDTVGVNTMAVDGAAVVSGDNTFMVLFWPDITHLEASSGDIAWPEPYLAGHAPQPVDFYEYSVFDTRYPYPDATSVLYATGYAPGTVLKPDAGSGYRRLSAVDVAEKGRYDFLGCDVWREVYKGSQTDPFAQNKNRLYFRHLSSKLVFYADRDKTTMENRQYVRNVTVTNLQMSIDGGENWTQMHTPSGFVWDILKPDDFTASYTKTIESIRLVAGNEGVNTAPKAGYRTVESTPFAGVGSDFVLQKNASDRVPVDGMSIDSCYVCNRIVNGIADINKPIKLKMDISAEMSFDPNFSMGDSSGSITDDLTFTKTWRGEITEIHRVDDAGRPTTGTVDEFRPGNEYRVYIRFYRTDVNLVALELPWNIGGVHYITIPGGDRQNN